MAAISSDHATAEVLLEVKLSTAISARDSPDLSATSRAIRDHPAINAPFHNGVALVAIRQVRTKPTGWARVTNVAPHRTTSGEKLCCRQSTVTSNLARSVARLADDVLFAVFDSSGPAAMRACPNSDFGFAGRAFKAHGNSFDE